MNLSQLRAIIAVAEQGNFSEAGLSLNVSQSSISHAIASLEEELGVPLFVRGRHGAVLTSAGARITEHAWQALRSIELMQREANHYKYLTTFSPSLNIVYKINYGTTIVGMVKQGLGVAILPRLAAEPIPEPIRVYNLPEPLVMILGAAVLSNVLHVPAVFAFLDMLKQNKTEDKR